MTNYYKKMERYISELSYEEKEKFKDLISECLETSSNLDKIAEQNLENLKKIDNVTDKISNDLKRINLLIDNFNKLFENKIEVLRAIKEKEGKIIQ